MYQEKSENLARNEKGTIFFMNDDNCAQEYKSNTMQLHVCARIRI